MKEKSSLEIKSTFLGAHTYPVVHRENHSAYIRTITEEMLPVIAKEKLADYIDVFCENGFFSPEETETIVRAGQQYGLKPKLHVNQLNSIGGIETGIKLNALSMDHLETLHATEIEQIKNSGWKGFCTLLPTAAFFLRLSYPPARQLLDAGCAIALASDYNPGSSPEREYEYGNRAGMYSNEIITGRSGECRYDQWSTCHGSGKFTWIVYERKTGESHYNAAGSFTGISSVSFWLKSY